MIFEQAREIIKLVSYKPDFEISVRPNAEIWRNQPGITIHIIRRDAQDADFINPPSSLSGSYSLDEQALKAISPQALVEWVRHSIKQFEFHEVDEWIRLNGVKIFDPHGIPKTVDEALRGRSYDMQMYSRLYSYPTSSIITNQGLLNLDPILKVVDAEIGLIQRILLGVRGVIDWIESRIPEKIKRGHRSKR